MKILVADDSKTTRTLLSASLNKLGHEVIEAENGQKAIDLFKERHPDLIILDVIMEGIDGFECAKMIRGINSEDWIPIIFLSGAVDDENIARGINAGGDDYLTKPYSEITLFAKIKAMQRIADMRNSLCEMTQKFIALSSTDALTGLYNRLQFDRTIIEKISNVNRYNKMISLLFVDLDKFKIINDTLGHYIGDLLLIEVAKRLKSCIRLDDFIARIGGDEFAIILHNIENENISDTVADKIIHAIAKPFNIAGNIVSVSASIGISCYPSKESNENNIIHNADIAMYHAKVSGRNNYKHYSAEMGEKHCKEINIKEALKYAITRNELYLTYQPIYDLKSKEFNRAEVLVCWRSKNFGMISAEYFIPLAEELELIDKIGEWVLRAACAQQKKWKNAGCKDIILSINLSPCQLVNKKIPQMISKILNESQIQPTSIELELTETSSLIYSDLSETLINAIHQLGVNITLDDFGTGYSSLMHLRKLPINAIKIDKSFVHDITSDPHNSKIIKSVIILGNNLNYKVIAEGIETEEQLKFLIDNKCELGQGFYLSKTLTEEQMTKLLMKSNIIA